MTEKYVIHWVSRVNGRAGYGTRKFTRHEADSLVAELNEEYPDIQHEAVPAASAHNAAEVEIAPEAQAQPRQEVTIG